QAARNTTDSRNISRRPDFIAPVLPSLNAVSPRASFPTFKRSSSPLNALSGIEARQARPIHRINLAIKITKWDDPVPLPRAFGNPTAPPVGSLDSPPVEMSIAAWSRKHGQPVAAVQLHFHARRNRWQRPKIQRTDIFCDDCLHPHVQA